MGFNLGFQDADSVCPKCRKLGLKYRLSTTGPWVLEKARATCSECHCEAYLWLDDHGDGTASVLPLVPGMDYDDMRFPTLVGLHRVAAEALRRGAGDAELKQQVNDLDAAIRRRTWEIVGSIDGRERSLGRWQTKERCEQYVKANFVPEGDHSDSSGTIRSFRYKYVHHQ